QRHRDGEPRVRAPRLRAEHGPQPRSRARLPRRHLPGPAAAAASARVAGPRTRAQPILRVGHRAHGSSGGDADVQTSPASRRGRTLLVGNPTARSGKARKFIDDALEIMEEQGLAPEFLATLPEGKTVTALADRLEQDDVERVAYMGGDGTFAEA